MTARNPAMLEPKSDGYTPGQLVGEIKQLAAEEGWNDTYLLNTTLAVVAGSGPGVLISLLAAVREQRAPFVVRESARHGAGETIFRAKSRAECVAYIDGACRFSDRCEPNDFVIEERS